MKWSTFLLFALSLSFPAAACIQNQCEWVYRYDTLSGQYHYVYECSNVTVPSIYVPVTVTGVVTAAGQPLSGATVTAISAKSVTANSSGIYQVSYTTYACPGDYVNVSLCSEYPTFAAVCKNVSAYADYGINATVNFAMTPPPPPTVNLSVNGLKGPISVDVGDSVNVAWSSTSGATFSSTFAADSMDGCGNSPTPTPWIANTATGNAAITVAGCGSGHTYTSTYTATNYSGSATATAKVIVRPIPTTPSGLAAFFHFVMEDGGPYSNLRGANEKYFMGKSLGADNGGWYFIRPNGSLYAWSTSGGVAGSTLLATVPSSYWTNPITLIEAALPSGLPTNAVALENAYLFRESGKGFYNSYRGWGENYYQDKLGNWYFIVSTGTVYQFKTNLQSSVAIAKLDASYYSEPNKIAMPNFGTSAASLAAAYQFVLSDGGTYANYRGGDEKYFMGRVLNADNVGWYFVRPSGAVYSFSVSGGLLGSQLIGLVPPNYYANPITLVESSLSSSLPSDVSALQTTYSWHESGNGLYTNYHGWNENYYQDRTGAWYFMVSTGTMYRYVNSLQSSIAVAKLDPGYYLDPAAISTPSTVVDAKSLAISYGFVLEDGGPFTNARGAGEKYFMGKVLNSDNGGWYFIRPGGAVYAWSTNGGLPYSVFLGTVAPIYYTNPILLVESALPSGLPSNAGTVEANLKLAIHSSGLYTNYRGWGEKYLVDPNGNWYFLVATGTLYRFISNLQNSLPVAALDPSYFVNPALLVALPH